MLRFAVFITLVSLAGAGCTHDTRESEVLHTETFVAVTAELLRHAGGRGTSAPADSVLSRAGVTRGAYELSVRWYSSDAGQWSDVMNRVVAMLSAVE